MKDLLEEKTRLTKLRVYCIGLVDSPAIRRQFLVLKRNTPTKKALTEADIAGSDTERLNKQGGETKVKPDIKTAVEQAQKEVLEKIGKGESVAVEEKVKDPPEVVEVVEKEDEVIEEDPVETPEEKIAKEIEANAKDLDLDPQEKSAHSAFMGKCLKSGKGMKECALEWSKAHPKKTEKGETEEGVTKAKVKVSVETEEKGQKEDGEPKVAGTFAGAFGKVFSVFDRNIGAAKKDEEKRRWQALKALLSKTIGALPVQKSEDFESLQAGLDALTGEVDTLLKADPAVSAEGFKPILLALDKLIGKAEGDVKTALEKTKSMLSKLIGGIQTAPAVKGAVEVTQPEEMALLGQQLEELTGKVDKLVKGQADHQVMLDKIPVPKALVKKEDPRKQGEDSEDLLEKHKGETAPVQLRSVIKDLEKQGKS